ncbi:GldM family protein [Ferruginibacter sp. SUN106]|uniref:type IX secretion system motor protein PorM/GldM n=1 Tax=Ferruginibacter sp. SUN106 TaxID=2978348 RepID=UPI003D35CFA2
MTAILALNVSAEVIEAFKTVDKSLTTSSSNLGTSTAATFKSLGDKTKDPKTAEQATKWYPKADAAVKLTKALNDYIESLKDSLELAAGRKMVEKDGKMVKDFKLDGLDASTRLFETEGRGDQLKAKLDQYKKDMLAIDPEIKAKYEATFPVNTDPIPSQEGGTKPFTQGYFHMTPTIAALTMLSKFQNNVKNAENQIVSYIHSKVGAVEYVYDQFKPIIGTSSTYLMPGEDMTITAGIGSFSSSANPIITINGVSKPADADGVATNTFKVSGSGSAHVKISFKKPDGTEGTVEKDIPYTVGQPSSAAVSLDKMDVFYIGLDNPITIASPTGMEQTGVSGTGCVISGSGPKRTVSVSAPGTCTITVSPKGSTPFSHTYRIKRIPEPEFKVGSGKPRMPSVEFKNQTACRADMGPDFIYDVKYSVLSATVYFSGAGFPNVATTTINSNNLSALSSYFSRCVPGTSITFDNVKVQGPDGVRVIEGKTFSLF